MLMLLQYFKRRRSFATGLASAGSGAGTFIIAVITRRLLDDLGWRWTLRWLAVIISSVVFLAGTSFIPVGVSARTAVHAARIAVRMAGVRAFRKQRYSHHSEPRAADHDICANIALDDELSHLAASPVVDSPSVPSDSVVSPVATSIELVIAAESKVSPRVLPHDAVPESVPSQRLEDRTLVPVLHEHAFHRVRCLVCTVWFGLSPLPAGARRF